MVRLRVALAQIDLTVGDLDGNADLAATWTKQAAARDAHLVAFPEMALTGYPGEVLVLRPSFQDASRDALERPARRVADDGSGGVAVVVGYLDRSPEPSAAARRPAGEPRNAAALLWRGEVVARYAKHHLPCYGVFDEFRYFVPGTAFPVARRCGIDVALCMCADGVG